MELRKIDLRKVINALVVLAILLQTVGRGLTVLNSCWAAN